MDKKNNKEKKYFGTDGFRGEANETLTSMQAYKVGRFLGWYFSLKKENSSERARIVIGKDTRLSSYMLEYSIVAGITASGADAYMLHVTTTPSVSYVTRQEEFDCGIMITASHNPFYDNGIKVINRYGEKLDEATTALIESYLNNNLESIGIKEDDLPLAKGKNIGKIIDYTSGRNRYVGYLISVASFSYRNFRIGIDAANGASWMIAKAVFGALGAQMVVVGAEPDGTNINKDCGSTHIENLRRVVKENHLDFGFSFDGDADRCIAVDEQGEVVSGDDILYILGKRLKDKKILNNDTVVSTIMSNSGLAKSLEKIGIKSVQTDVGDRFVYECMQNGGYSLGGEESGHIILKKYATTGDGILTAIMIAEEISEKKIPLSKLKEGLIIYPQETKSIKVKNKDDVFLDAEVLKEKEEVERLIKGKGRVLLRKSGTEPVIRIMVEAERVEKCMEYIERLEKIIRKRGHGI